MNDLTGSSRRRQLILLSATACVAAIAYSLFVSLLALNEILVTGLIGDVFQYADLAEVMFNGALPYIDAKVEHLPTALIPILGLQALARLTGIPIWLLWPAVMSTAYVASVLFVDRFDFEKPAGFTYIAVSLPLLPLALFRIEPWIVLLAVMAVAYLAKKRTVIGVALIIAGTLGKGWPIAISILPWKQGKRLAAGVAVFASLAALAFVATQDGFQSGRNFEGIHSETIVGSVALLWRHILGEPLQMFSTAGARYVAVPTWLVAVNAVPGILAIGAAVAISRRKLETNAIISLIGFTVIGIILLSPLFSTQFMVWLTPFVAGISLANRRLYLAAALIGLASITIFGDESFLWTVEVVVANVLTLLLALQWGRELFGPTGSSDAFQDPNTSRKNLPV